MHIFLWDQGLSGLQVRIQNSMSFFLHAHGDLQDVIESVYEQEMFEMSQSNTYMGMWQIWQATNVLGRPIKSIFPDRGSQAFRSDFNWLCVPYNQWLRNKEPYYNMWTPTVQNGKIQHFVPLLKRK